MYAEPARQTLSPLSHDGSHAPRRSVGHLRLHFQQQPDASGCPTAKVTIEVQTPERPVYFTGTFVSEARPGFVTLQIPPLEQWDDPLKWISRSQRERFQEPGFYQLLQREITTRFCRCNRGTILTQATARIVEQILETVGRVRAADRNAAFLPSGWSEIRIVLQEDDHPLIIPRDEIRVAPAAMRTLRHDGIVKPVVRTLPMTAMPKSCRSCGDDALYQTEVSAGGGYAPNYLPQLGTFWASAKFTVVVCENCGETTFFAPADARQNLRESSEWRKV